MLYSQWPRWVQAAVIISHVLLGMAATLLWWPRTEADWRRLRIVAIYLLVFYIVMRFLFKA
jgi:hypothetical protein